MAGDLVQVTEELLKLHKDINFRSDLFFVNIIHLLLTIIRNICFTAVNNISNRKVETTFKSFKDIYSYYMKGGFYITTIHADGEFTPLQAMIYEHIPGGPRINLTRANEYVTDIERLVTVIKEIKRAVRHSLLFNNTPKLLTVYIVLTVVIMLKYFPVRGGLSAILRPNTKMYSDTIHYK